MWNGKCDDMKKILSASWSWQECDKFMSAYSDTQYVTNMKLKLVEQMDGSRMKNMEWIVNENDKHTGSKSLGVSPVERS